ncbi:hypothetical protein AGMMS49938_07820 [Fibrobacterales bacterium]|nr:hypothetical protein AGMMS49938_07820 [Fibrobacterales bacterium]
MAAFTKFTPMSKKELAHLLVDKVPNNKVAEVLNFLMFIQRQKEPDELLSVAENNLDFWDNSEDEVWDNV